MGPHCSCGFAGFSDAAQCLHHTSGKYGCRPTDSFPSQLVSPSHPPMECRPAFFQSPGDQTTAKAGEIKMCLIQEEKNICKDPTPAFPGFFAIRQDRPSPHRGSGLLTLVKEVKAYQRIAEDYHPPLEKQSTAYHHLLIIAKWLFSPLAKEFAEIWTQMTNLLLKTRVWCLTFWRLGVHELLCRLLQK